MKHIYVTLALIFFSKTIRRSSYNIKNEPMVSGVIHILNGGLFRGIRKRKNYLLMNHLVFEF